METILNVLMGLMILGCCLLVTLIIGTIINSLVSKESTTPKYDETIFTPPFRLGKRQKRAVLDSKGLEVIILPHNSEKQAQMYVDYLNNK